MSLLCDGLSLNVGGGPFDRNSSGGRTGVDRSLFGVLEVARGGVGVAWLEPIVPLPVEVGWKDFDKLFEYGLYKHKNNVECNK